MQKRFIDTITTHLTNNHLKIRVYQFLCIFLMINLISCTHITYLMTGEQEEIQKASDDLNDEELISETKPSQASHPQYIYCTPEDRRQGKKAIFGDINAPCGLSKIQPIENRTLEIERIISGVEQLPNGGDILLGHHLLLLKDGDKILQKIQVEKEDDPFWYEVVFVKIRKDVYWQDLNNDEKLEFAVLKTDSGYSSHRTADIYTLEADSFKFYGHGTYVWTTGEHVLLNCPKDCRHNNHDACSECL